MEDREIDIFYTASWLNNLSRPERSQWAAKLARLSRKHNVLIETWTSSYEEYLSLLKNSKLAFSHVRQGVFSNRVFEAASQGTVPVVTGRDVTRYFEDGKEIIRVTDEDFIDKVERGLFDHGIWAIFHMGACSSTTEKDADYLMRNNFDYSRRLASRFAGKSSLRFIYASSAATYGDGSIGYSDEHSTIPLLRPLNMYGYSKQHFDTWALKTGVLKNAVGLKYFNVFGPNEYHKGDMRSVVIRAYWQAKRSGKVRLFRSYRSEWKDGGQSRDFIYVRDAVRITLHFLERPEVNGIFNAGTGTARTFNDLALAVFSALGNDPTIEYIDMPEGLETKYQYYTCAQMEKIRFSGFKHRFMSLEEGVHDYVVNYLERDARCATAS
ncbi:MAG: ADP-glyceromanno-heptose 6-epimerase [Nitrospiraceae bacterium]|nr:MAG: ADP-glyceromanno-heptose 6-epimerase [Nitrospiraceae bacterium]